MSTINWNELENVTKNDIGKTAIFHPCGPTLTVKENLADAIRAWNDIAGSQDKITEEDLTQYNDSATTEDLCYAEIVNEEEK